MYELTLSDSAKKSIAKYRKSNPKDFKKVRSLVEELVEHPYTGTGNPEPLKGTGKVTYSREITKKDRLVYDIDDTKVTVYVVSSEGHYSDK